MSFIHYVVPSPNESKPRSGLRIKRGEGVDFGNHQMNMGILNYITFGKVSIYRSGLRMKGVKV